MTTNDSGLRDEVLVELVSQAEDAPAEAAEAEPDSD